jgi:type I restriction enzyme, S subunit
MLLLDLRGVPVVSRTMTNNVEDLRIEGGWTLISRSGTIGRTAFVRPQMVGMLLSEHAIRAAPVEGGIDAGYLFAYLSAGPTQAMIKQRTYGTIVQHIEPDHIADIPVPVPSGSDQKEIGDLVRQAADRRTEASRLLDLASDHFDLAMPAFRFSHDHQLASGLVRNANLRARLDAFYHAGWAVEGASEQGERLSEIADVNVPGRMKLVAAERGFDFLTGVDVYQSRPQATKKIARWLAGCSDLIVHSGQILLQVDGQRYGLLGRPAMVGSRVDGRAASWHLARITTEAAGRVVAYARSEIGRRSIVRISSGTSVPAITQTGLASVRIPSLPAVLNKGAEAALVLREEADREEDLAIQKVEAWLDS